MNNDLIVNNTAFYFYLQYWGIVEQKYLDIELLNQLKIKSRVVHDAFYPVYIRQDDVVFATYDTLLNPRFHFRGSPLFYFIQDDRHQLTPLFLYITTMKDLKYQHSLIRRLRSFGYRDIYRSLENLY